MSELQTHDPENGQLLKTYPVDTEAAVTAKLQSALIAQERWKELPMKERTLVLRRTAARLESEKSALAQLMKREMGKPLQQGEAEVEKCASCASFYAERGPGFLAPQEIKTEARRSFVAFEPLGLVLAVMPWNFPLWQVFRCAVPALLAGNGLILKHASNVTGSSLALEKIWKDALGEYRDLFHSVVLPGSEALKLISRPEISAVSFTGSTEVGRKIAAEAGRVLKKSVLELGGSDPYLVLEDADISRTAELCARSRLINGGQSCISAKRFLVVKSVSGPFLAAFTEAMTKGKTGSLAREDLRRDLHSQVERSIAGGASLLCGGKIPSGPGWHYPPTVLAGVRPGMAVFDEETFGPVAAVVEVEDEEEGIALANRTSFGLGAAVFTTDFEKGLDIATRRLQAGSCFVNDFVRSDPRLPFGGIKESGFGRELSEAGIREFVNVKTVLAQG